MYNTRKSCSREDFFVDPPPSLNKIVDILKRSENAKKKFWIFFFIKNFFNEADRYIFC